MEQEGKVDEDSSLTLQNMLQVALGGKGSLTQANIAIFYSVIKSILKKLNCEDEIVTIGGVPSTELQKLLSQANRCPMPCDERINVLTEKLDKLEELERQVYAMEDKLDKHLEKKFQQADEETISEEENIRDTKPLIQLHSILKRHPKRRMFGSDSVSYAGAKNSKEKVDHFTFNMKYLRNASAVSHVNVADGAEFGKQSGGNDDINNGFGEKLLELKKSFSAFKTQLDETGDEGCWNFANKSDEQPKETFEEFKKRLDETDGGWWDLPDKCEKSVGSKQAEEDAAIGEEASERVTESKAEESVKSETISIKDSESTKDKYCCYMPCEDVFTIPSPEYEVPRALLRSKVFCKGLRDFIRPTLIRRLRKIEYNMEDLVPQLHDCIIKVQKTENDIVLYDLVFDKIAELSGAISDNYIVVRDTLAGMQEIFDFKFDKCDVPEVKQEIAELIELCTRETDDAKKQLSKIRASAIVFMTDAEKRKQVASQRINDIRFEPFAKCSSEFCDCNHQESKLLFRIENLLTPNHVQQQMERHMASTKSLRLTNSLNFSRDFVNMVAFADL